MTYPVSTAPAAKAWLYAQIQAAITTDPGHALDVAYAPRTTGPDSPDDVVWLGPVSNRSVTRLAFVGGMGEYALQEEYDLTVNINVYRAGEDPGATYPVYADPAQDAETRAWAVAGIVETVARTDPTMGGAVNTSRPAQTPQCDVEWDDEGNGRVASLSTTIHCFSPI